MKHKKLLFLIAIFIIILGVFIQFAGKIKDKVVRPEAEGTKVENGYKILAVIHNLRAPTAFCFSPKGDMYVAEIEDESGNSRVIKIGKYGRKQEVCGDLTGPIWGVAYYQDRIYIGEKGHISMINQKGQHIDIITGLPCDGDFQNNQMVFGPDGKLYFGMGSATNSGVVGEDDFQRGWLKVFPEFHDIPPKDIVLRGTDYETSDFLHLNSNEKVMTGGFVPFGRKTVDGMVIKGNLLANAVIYRSDPDGGELEHFAWGFRNPFALAFSLDGELYVSEEGMEDVGSRPVYNTKNYIYQVREGIWYGWPDYIGGIPVTHPKFASESGKHCSFLLKNHENTPVPPVFELPLDLKPKGLAFSTSEQFGFKGHGFISVWPGKGKGSEAEIKIIRFDPVTGEGWNFAVNSGTKSANDKDKLQTPITLKFGPDQALYVLDYGYVGQQENMLENINKKSGVVWKIIPAENGTP